MTTVFFTKSKVSSDEFILSCFAKYSCLIGKAEKKVSVDRNKEKPRFFEDETQFSLSHSGKYTVCAMSDKTVGVDIQEIRDVNAADISERFFGERITDLARFFDEFSKGEATVKYYEIPFTEGIKRREGKNYRIFDGYSFALCGEEPSYFIEI